MSEEKKEETEKKEKYWKVSEILNATVQKNVVFYGKAKNSYDISSGSYSDFPYTIEFEEEPEYELEHASDSCAEEITKAEYDKAIEEAEKQCSYTKKQEK